MKKQEIFDMPWTKVKDWSECPASNRRLREYYITKKDIEIFVVNLFRDIARTLKIPYSELKSILFLENESFFKLKEQLFKNNLFAYHNQDPRIIELQKTLRVPDIEYVDKVDYCFKKFQELNDSEKTLFLEKIGKIEITINLDYK